MTLMDLSPLIATAAAVVGLLANSLKVWEFVSARLSRLFKKTSLLTSMN